MKQSPTIDVGQFIDERPFGRYQLLVAVLCGMVVFIDGFDAQIMGFVATALAADLHLPRVAIGTISSSGLFGMMLGALLCGPLADRFGRRPVLVVCTMVFAAGALLTSTGRDLNSLIAFRFLTGLGLGGALPNSIAMTAEFTPRRVRATGVMLMFSGLSLGAATGGLIAGSVIPRFGWQAMFVVGGMLPCLMSVVLLALLPESIRFLVLKGGQPGRVARSLSRLSPGFVAATDARFVAEQRRSNVFAVKQLFSPLYRRRTALLWVIFFASLLDLYFISSWLPTVINDAGVSVRNAIYITSLFQIGGAMGTFFLGRVMDRQLSFRVLAWIYFGAAIGVVLIGVAGVSVPLLVLTVTAAGVGVVGGQTGANALASEGYPTEIRSTGVGWALGIGRIGSIIGPYMGGRLLTPQTKASHVFFAASIPPLVAMTAALMASRNETKEEH